MPPRYDKNPLYTPEFKASVRHDCEETEEPMWSIARRHGISEITLQRMVKREGWRMRAARMHELAPAQFLLQETQAILAAAQHVKPAPQRARSASKTRREEIVETQQAPSPTLRTDPPLSGEREARVASPEASLLLSAIERIEKLLLGEIECEEARRAKFVDTSRPTEEAARTARTLAVLTQTANAIRQIKIAEATTDHKTTDDSLDHDDELPHDIDEFRRDLARRIDAFVASRTDIGDDPGDPEPAALDEAG